MARDLAPARQHLADPSTLVVFSGNGTSALCPELASSVVTVDARLQVALSKTDRLHGSKQALAAHAARELLPTTRPWPPRAGELRKAYEDLVNNVDPPDIPKREPSTDEVVQTFIEEQLRENPKLGWTPLLRRWRSSGRACEQSRFRDLYREVKERMSSTTRDQ